MSDAWRALLAACTRLHPPRPPCASHLNSFGYTSPVPKKRLERLVKELGDAEKQLARGR